MRKLFAGLFSAALLTGSAVGLTSTTATAAPYPGSVNTTCHSWASGKAYRDTVAKVYFAVTATGNGNQHGRAKFHLDRRNSARTYDFNKLYPGGEQVYRLDVLKPGVYDVVARFSPRPADSIYQRCAKSFVLRVRWEDKP